MLEKLSEGIKEALRKITKAGYIDKNVLDELAKDINRSLLASDVNVKLATELTNRIKERALNEKPSAGFTPKDNVMKIVYEELVRIVGKKSEFSLKPGKILFVGTKRAAQETIKEPIVLEFVGLPESHRLVESKLEEAIINNLQEFLLELGKGFAFVARQKRLTLDGDHFYADLVFYHVILKCYVIIDIKTKKLSHADLGQMQLYVNYFDEEIVTPNDNPSIGLILCTKKSDAMVKYTLGEKAKQIFASTYQFHLPTEKELEAELKREIKEIESLSDKGSIG